MSRTECHSVALQIEDALVIIAPRGDDLQMQVLITSHAIITNQHALMAEVTRGLRSKSNFPPHKGTKERRNNGATK